MIQGYQVFDADAHAMFTPKMWEGLPEEYVARRADLFAKGAAAHRSPP